MKKGDIWQLMCDNSYKTSHSEAYSSIVGKKAIFIPLSYLCKKMFNLDEEFTFGFKIRVKRFSNGKI